MGKLAKLYSGDTHLTKVTLPPYCGRIEQIGAINNALVALTSLQETLVFKFGENKIERVQHEHFFQVKCMQNAFDGLYMVRCDNTLVSAKLTIDVVELLPTNLKEAVQFLACGSQFRILLTGTTIVAWHYSAYKNREKYVKFADVACI